MALGTLISFPYHRINSFNKNLEKINFLKTLDFFLMDVIRLYDCLHLHYSEYNAFQYQDYNFYIYKDNCSDALILKVINNRTCEMPYRIIESTLSACIEVLILNTLESY